ncbi:MAG: SDR family NAD(P)-dependent oxidoreductase [Cytophagales bacterium]|nr:SDR family NAD(P)-dependent oxidoreductase [Cytophagales bacterium]
MEKIKRWALVTGANKGIGLEVSRQLAEVGFIVWMGVRDLDKGQKAAEKLQQQGLMVQAIHLDMNLPATFESVRQQIELQAGQLDVLVNNAGFANDFAYTAATVPGSLLRSTFEVNFFALIDLTQQLLPLLLKSPAGRIVNQSSVLGSLTMHSTPGAGLENMKPLAYNSSKTALNAFTVHLADALRHTPIKVNSAHPGSVLTDTNPMGELTPVEGARTAVRLATLDETGPTGAFFFGDERLPW